MAITNIDEQKLEAFIGHAATDVGGAMSAPLVMLGDRLGLYQAMADGQPVARRAGRAHRDQRALHPRVAEREGRGRLPRLRRRTRRPTCFSPSKRWRSPTRRARVSMPGLFQASPPRWGRASAIAANFRTGDGVDWRQHPACSRVPSGSSAGYLGNLIPRGCLPSTVSSPSSSAARASPTSAAATARRRSSWPRRIPVEVRRLRLPRRARSSWRASAPARPASPTG